jgi:putative hydrolase of the HAD superfamily
MEKDLLKSIKVTLDELEPMVPIETRVKPVLGKIDVQAVVFDIYGTLLISDSGDVMEAQFLNENLQRALDRSGIRVRPVDGMHRAEILGAILDEFRASISRQHKKYKESGETPFPEVDIIETWEAVIQYFHAKGWVEEGKYCNCKVLSYTFELLSNKIWPMPGMKKLVKDLEAKEIPLGIVSNAQAYTPVFMNYFLNGVMDNTLEIEPFDPRLTVYSFKEKRAKPDHFLFDLLADALRKHYNITPKNAVYIGNDMLNDIYAAKEVGFQTVLFAGDKRSLRLRKDNSMVKGVSPDFTITELQQLSTMIS